jgi:dihydrofolate reductase
MAKVTYSMSVSLDGFVAARDGDIGWTSPDDELHRFFNDQLRGIGAFLHGRKTYELMAAYWPTADDDPSAPAPIVDFARIWKTKPKVVFSRTLRDVAWNSRIVRDDIGGEIMRLKAQAGGDLALGGPGIASSVMKLGLIDEYRLFVRPVVLGGGTSYFPSLDHGLALRLVETRTFHGGVMFLRYERAAD